METTTLVLVPGLGLGADAWAPTREALGARPTTVATLPGFGVRASRDLDLRPPARAASLLASLEDIPGPLVLIGHSASCQVVVAAALQAPRRVAGLVLVGPTTDPRAGTWPRLLATWLATAVHEDPRQLPVLVGDYGRTGLESMRRGMEAAREHRTDLDLPLVGCPVLVLRGRHDRICSAGWADTLAAAAPLGTSRTLASGAHMVPLTRGRLVAEQLEAFCSS
jgi:pimeloyl-ACP methyl ester carboxylesterase